MKLKFYLLIIVLLTGIIVGIVFFQLGKSDTKSDPTKIFTVQELSKFSGVDPKLPIYLALDGNVYDVSKGKEFYQVGAPYHNLAGKDSSRELHIAGGSIIKSKYPIIGRLSASQK